MKATTPTQKPIPIFCSRVIPFKVGEIYRERETMSVRRTVNTWGRCPDDFFLGGRAVEKGPGVKKKVVKGANLNLESGNVCDGRQTP
jgi:hypothetical protein